MDALALALAAVALAAAAGLAAAALRLRSPASFLLAAYLLASATLVVLTQVLSPLRLVGRGGYALGLLVALAAAASAWVARGRPPPPRPRLRLRAAAGDPLLAGFAVLVLAAILYELAVGLTTPPNNGDALTYHLTRAAAWLRHGGLHRIPGPGKTPENDYPPNAEIEVLFTFAFARSDVAAAMPQLVAGLAAVVAVFGIARRLGHGRRAAAFAALLAPALAQVALQSMTTQNDLVAGALVATAAYFLHARERADVWLAGLAVGLALGTKLTVVFALPALAVVAIAALPRRALASAAVATLLGFAAVGGVSYAANVLRTGSPLGTLSGDPGRQRPEITAGGTVASAARYAYGLLDFSGYPLDHRDLRLPTAAARKAYEALRIPANPPESTAYPFGFAFNVRANEDVSFFGPLGFLLVAPLAAAFLVLGLLRRTDRAHAAHAAALPLYLLALALGYRYGGQGRFLITPVLLTLPLAAPLHRRAAGAVVLAVAAVSLVLVHAHNETKPTGLRGTTPFWRLERSEALGLRGGFSVGTLVDALESTVPADARLGVVTGEHDADYVLYGPRFTRDLVPLPPASAIAAAEREGLRWVYLGRLAPVPREHEGWQLEPLSDAGALLSRR